MPRRNDLKLTDLANPPVLPAIHRQKHSTYMYPVIAGIRGLDARVKYQPARVYVEIRLKLNYLD